MPSALAQCELEGLGWTWSSSGVSDCAFPISLNVFGIVAVVLVSLKPRHHGKVPYPRRGWLVTSSKDTKQNINFYHMICCFPWAAHPSLLENLVEYFSVSMIF